MTQDLILRVKYNGIITDLDVLNDVPLRVDMSTVETTELGRIFGIGSQQFSLPGTKKNNKFFKNGYDISASDIPGMYSPIDAWVIQNGETLLFGALQLEEIVTSEDGYIDYKVNIVDKTIQFKDALKNKFLYQADWAPYDHTLTSGSIIDSWTTDISGAVYYPLVDYGRTDDIIYPDVPRIQINTGSNGGINSVITPLQSRQLLPATKLKTVVDLIFDQVGFRYTGSFLESDDFNNLYMLTKANDEFGPVVGEGNLTTFAATNNGQFLDVDNNYNILTCSIELSDPAGGYDTSTSVYDVQVLGQYDLYASTTFFNPIDNGSSAAISVTLQLCEGPSTSSFNVVDEQSFIVIDPAFDGIGPFELSVGAANVSGDVIDVFFARVKAELVAGPGGYDDPMFLSTNTLGTTRGPINYEGASISVADQINPGFKSEDVIKGLIQQFNLVMIPDQNDQSTIRIETFDDWIREGEIKDWTDKYDESRRIGIASTIKDLPKEIKLKNADDNDRFSKIAKEQEPFFQYGTLRLIAESTNAQGSTDIGDVFSPVVLGSILRFNATGSDGKLTFELDTNGENQRLVVPHLYKLNNAAQETFSFKPRIGYKVSNNLPSGSQIAIGNPGGASFNTQVTGSYTTISNLSALPAVSGSTNDLHFNNTYGTFGPSQVLGLNNGVTSYENYWKTYYESLYWDEGKKITLDLQFDPYEYKNIKLNDRIVIKNQYYRINKIKGFNISQRDVVTVELVRLYPAYFQLT